LALAAIAACLFPIAASAQTKEVNIYTTREPGLIQPILDAYTKETGVKVNSIFVKEGLAERVKTEGANSPADLMIMVDIGNLNDLVDAGITQPIVSKKVDEAVPAHLRAKDDSWVATTLRSRAIYSSKERIKDAPKTYEELADAKYKGKVCIRAGNHPYNVALLAQMIVKDGAEKTEKFLTDLKANLARKAGGGDRDVARDILAGICDVGIANTYYVGLMRTGKDAEQVKWGQAINVTLPTFADGKGTHVNVSGVALAKNAPNKDEAVKLVEYFVTPEAQKIFAEANFEYPVTKGAPINAEVASWGELKPDTTSLTEVAAARKQAAELVDKVGFNN
jgi:iron(III) transport system substrate-binding protein